MNELTIRYLCTMDESVETQYRQLQALGPLWRYHLRGIFGMAIFSFVPAIFFPYNLFEKFKLGATLFVLYGCSYYFFHEAALRKNLRRHLKRRLGTEKPIDTEFSLTEEGIKYRTLGTAMVFEWAIVGQVKEEPKWLEVRLKPSGLILFPKRVFTEAEFLEWSRFIGSHANQTPSPVA